MSYNKVIYAGKIVRWCNTCDMQLMYTSIIQKKIHSLDEKMDLLKFTNEKICSKYDSKSAEDHIYSRSYVRYIRTYGLHHVYPLVNIIFATYLLICKDEQIHFFMQR